MELILTEEQKLLKDSAAKFMEQCAGTGLVRQVRDDDAPFDRQIWRKMADAGWLAVLVPEEMGGLGMSMTDLALILEEAGKALLPGPLAAAAASANILAEGPDAAARQELIAGIIGGEIIVVPALQEKTFAIDPEAAVCRATEDGGGWHLSGEKSFIPEAGGVDGFLVNADSPDGLILCYVPAGSAGAGLSLSRSVDGADTGTLSLDKVSVPNEHMIAGSNQASEACRKLQNLTLLGLGAELLGIMETALEMSIEYIKIRHQFGQPIGSFQALQHRAANDYMDCELTRSFVFQTCAAADRGEDISALASAVKAKASAAALTITKSAIQFHGAIGVSDEHDIGLYLKRAIALSTYYGNEMAHRGRYAKLSGISPAD
ncbi:MAG: acyl-CoA/acyl-ACP dehydrogenase [Rhodospirillales bacterium]|nr:acyl-CoA/acyl-ACP dehydrogenase [Rhodospirillales bacterium]